MYNRGSDARKGTRIVITELKNAPYFRSPIALGDGLRSDCGGDLRCLCRGIVSRSPIRLGCSWDRGKVSGSEFLLILIIANLMLVLECRSCGKFWIG